MRTCVVCSVKDEGPFLVEWVAWYRMLGFRRIVVITNDCTDHSPALLDALSAAGWITHLRCDIPPGGRITDTKLALARRTPLVYRADWVFVCDVDEFLVVHVGENQISDLLTYPEAPFLGMAINWQVFGDAGKTRWSDGLTHRDHLRAAPPGHRNAVWQKSLFRQPRWFTSLGEHGPRGLQMGRVDPTFPAQGIRWVNSEGDTLRSWVPDGPYLRHVAPQEATHRVAQLNHYMVRDPESFTLKRGTAAPVSGADRYNDTYLASNNRNEMPDQSALIYGARFDSIHAAAMALPGVARLHHLCCADYVKRLVTKAGNRPRLDPRWQWHVAQASAQHANA